MLKRLGRNPHCFRACFRALGWKYPGAVAVASAGSLSAYRSAQPPRWLLHLRQGGTSGWPGKSLTETFFGLVWKWGIQKTHGHLYSGKPMTNIDKPMDLGVQHSDKLKLESQNASKRGLGLKMQCKYKKWFGIENTIEMRWTKIEAFGGWDSKLDQSCSSSIFYSNSPTHNCTRNSDHSALAKSDSPARRFACRHSKFRTIDAGLKHALVDVPWQPMAGLEDCNLSTLTPVGWCRWLYYQTSWE